MAYEKMWGVKKGENLSLLRAFRDEILADSEVGRDYIFMLYSNSLEILILLIQYPSLIKEVKKDIDEILPGIQSILNGDKVVLSGEQLANLKSLLTSFETKATPGLKKVIRRVKKDINNRGILKPFGINIHK